MSRKLLIFVYFTAVITGCIGCRSTKEAEDWGQYSDWGSGAPRLVIEGRVSSRSGEKLPGIYVSVYGVREEKEPDIPSYNYAVTDSAGAYTIIRYRGRGVPVDVTVVATDSAGVYAEQVQFVPITYDSVRVKAWERTPYNGYVTADFVLEEQ